MKKNLKQERRLHPRIQKRLPLKVVANGYDFSTITENISCVGAYCHIDKYVPPFTKIAVKISLPMPAKTKDGRAVSNQIDCKGVIVRTEDEKNGGFNIAVFFNEIGNSQRKRISQYISQFLSGKPPAK